MLTNSGEGGGVGCAGRVVNRLSTDAIKRWWLFFHAKKKNGGHRLVYDAGTVFRIRMSQLGIDRLPSLPLCYPSPLPLPQGFLSLQVATLILLYSTKAEGDQEKNRFCWTGCWITGSIKTPLSGFAMQEIVISRRPPVALTSNPVSKLASWMHKFDIVFGVHVHAKSVK